MRTGPKPNRPKGSGGGSGGGGSRDSSGGSVERGRETTNISNHTNIDNDVRRDCSNFL